MMTWPRNWRVSVRCAWLRRTNDAKNYCGYAFPECLCWEIYEMSRNRLLPTPSANEMVTRDAEKLRARRERCKAKKKNGNGFGLTLSNTLVLGEIPESTSSPAECPVNQPQQPGSDWAREMTAGSGRKLLDSYASFLPRGASLRTLLVSLVSTEEWYSTRCWLTWKVSVTKSHRLLFRLAVSVRGIGGTGFSLWPTPVGSDVFTDSMQSSQQHGTKHSVTLSQAVMLPTPQVDDANQVQRKTGCFASLTREARMFASPNARDSNKGSDAPPLRFGASLTGLLATPCVDDAKNNSSKSEEVRPVPNLNVQVGGKLNADWVEWLMMIPPGWTDKEI